MASKRFAQHANAASCSVRKIVYNLHKEYTLYARFTDSTNPGPHLRQKNTDIP